MQLPFVLRVIAYHGEPKQVGKVLERASTRKDVKFESGNVVNDPDAPSDVIDLNYDRKHSNYGLTELLDDFEDEYDCKVAVWHNPDLHENNVKVQEFDVCEPSWKDETEAEDVVDDLTSRLSEWCEGYPTGK